MSELYPFPTQQTTSSRRRTARQQRMPLGVVGHLGVSETRSVFPSNVLTATVAQIVAEKKARRRG